MGGARFSGACSPNWRASHSPLRSSWLLLSGANRGGQSWTGKPRLACPTHQSTKNTPAAATPSAEAVVFLGPSWTWPIVDRQAKACLSNASVQRIFVDRHFLPTQSALIPRCRSGSGCAIAAPACHGETDLGQALFCGCGMEDAFFGLWVRFVIRWWLVRALSLRLPTLRRSRFGCFPRFNSFLLSPLSFSTRFGDRNYGSQGTYLRQ